MSEKDKYPSELAERFQIRLPEGMRDRIRAAAVENGRSMNAEIIDTLEQAYPDPEQFREELMFFDEIEEIQRKLDRIRRVRAAELSPNASEEFLKENAEKLQGRDKKKSKD